MRSHLAASSSFCSWGWLWISNPPACTSQELESQGQKPELPSWKTSSPPNELHPLLTSFYWSKSLEHKSAFYLHNSLALVIFITLHNYTTWLLKLCVLGGGSHGESNPEQFMLPLRYIPTPFDTVSHEVTQVGLTNCTLGRTWTHNSSDSAAGGRPFFFPTENQNSVTSKQPFPSSPNSSIERLILIRAEFFIPSKKEGPDFRKRQRPVAMFCQWEEESRSSQPVWWFRIISVKPRMGKRRSMEGEQEKVWHGNLESIKVKQS